MTLLPEKSNSESLAASLIEYFGQQPVSLPMLVLRGDRGSDVLSNALHRASVPFREVVVYESSDLQKADPIVCQQLAAGDFDWLTVTSSAIAANAAKLFVTAIGQTKVVSISPTTSAAAIEAGLRIAAEATEYNATGIVAAITKHMSENRP